MARTAQQRYDGAIEYINKNIDSGLAKDIAKKITNKTNAGNAISLSGGGFSFSGSQQHHWALRSLLLCQQAYLLGSGAHNFLKATQSTAGNTAKTFFKGKSEAQVKEAIKSYTVKKGLTREGLADVAKTTNGTDGDFVFATRTRSENSLGRNPVCFNAVRLWLFKAGFVSLRWLASEGYGLDANTCNTILGSGKEITPEQLPKMPKGYMFNFHAKKSPSTCHWGISLGDGYAVGSNTTAQENGGKAKVDFRNGNSIYGTFSLQSSYEVCRYKYKLVGESIGDVVIRQIDPTQVRTFF